MKPTETGAQGAEPGDGLERLRALKQIRALWESGGYGEPTSAYAFGCALRAAFDAGAASQDRRILELESLLVRAYAKLSDLGLRAEIGAALRQKETEHE